MATNLKLKEKSNLYKLIIPKEVENKIRTLLNSIYNIEWSGILFYTCEGTLKEGITVTCKDVLPMNIGNSVFTEFEVNEEILPYMVEHDLLDCQQSLIHSHHSMSTFFSSTDMETLDKEGSERNNFVSLIVNNAGTYSAAITWKETYTIQGTATLFGEEQPIEEAESETRVCYSPMTIVREGEEQDVELLNRIEELKKNRRTTPASPYVATQRNSSQSKVIEIPFPEEKESILPMKGSDIDADKEGLNIPIPEDIFNAAVAQLCTGSITAKRLPQKDLEKTLKLVEERFTDRFLGHDKELEQVINTFTEQVVEGLSDHYAEYYNHYDKTAEFAQSLVKELEKYAKYLSHLDVVICSLKEYYE